MRPRRPAKPFMKRTNVNKNFKSVSPRKRLFRFALYGLASCAFGCLPFALSATTANVSIVNFAFSPPSVNINVNDSVNWTWAGSPHSTTSDMGLWESGVRGTGAIFTHTFTSAGSFPFHCSVHPFMTGTITVQSADVPPTVIISNPTNGSVFAAPATLNLTATASDSDGSVTNVQFFQGTTSLGSVANSPYSVTVRDLAAGNYTFSAVAADNAGTKVTNSVMMRVVSPEPTTLTAGQRLSPSSFQFSYSATVGLSYVVQRSAASTPRSAPLDPLEERVEERMLPIPTHHPLLDYKFTNELGQQVSLSDFRGQALAITFFFTRCPIPDYCPRLSKNFQEASTRLSLIAAGPTNWHFLSVSFDTQFDSPRVLKAYGEMYHYDPAHWSFLVGSAESVGELVGLSNVKVERDAGSFNHNFRTLIIDAAGHLQMVFPTGGDLSSAIVDEILKAANVTNRSLEHASRSAPSP